MKQMAKCNRYYFCRDSEVQLIDTLLSHEVMKRRTGTGTVRHMTMTTCMSRFHSYYTFILEHSFFFTVTK